jgi:hypothetical protein
MLSQKWRRLVEVDKFSIKRIKLSLFHISNPFKAELSIIIKTCPKVLEKDTIQNLLVLEAVSSIILTLPNSQFTTNSKATLSKELNQFIAPKSV